MDELEFLKAECAIRQLHAKFVDAVWRKDGEAYGNTFTEDGEWKLAAKHMRGREEIQSTFSLLMGYTAKVQMILGPSMLEVNGDEATSRTNCTELTKLPDGNSSMAIGIYYDRYVKRDGQWLFSWRHFGLHYRGPMDFSEELVTESPDFGPFPGMPEWDEPTVTRMKPAS